MAFQDKFGAYLLERLSSSLSLTELALKTGQVSVEIMLAMNQYSCATAEIKQRYNCHCSHSQYRYYVQDKHY